MNKSYFGIAILVLVSVSLFSIITGFYWLLAALFILPLVSPLFLGIWLLIESYKERKIRLRESKEREERRKHNAEKSNK